MKKINRIIVLIDFSKYSENLADFSFSISRIINAEVVFVHQISGVAPAMADQATRDKIVKAESEEAHSRLRDLAKGRIDTDDSFHVSQKPILSILRDLVQDYYFDWVFAGLKGAGTLQRLFIGSTTLSIINDSDLLTVAVPVQTKFPVPEKLMVGVNPKHPLNKLQFSTVLSGLKDQISELEFFSILREGENEDGAKDHLSELQKEYESYEPVIQLYRGESALDLLKNRMELTEDSFLVLQQGSHSLTNQLFRKFMINELVYNALTPLIVLSK